MDSKTEYLLDEGKFIRQTTTRQIIGDQNEILASLVEPVPVEISCLSIYENQKVHALMYPNQVIVLTPLPKLPMRVHMAFETKTSMLWAPTVNSFNFNGDFENSVLVKEPWSPPEGYRILFCAMLKPGTGSWMNYLCHLLLQTPEGKLIAPNYPNVHNNGTICMGTKWHNEISIERPLLDQFIHDHKTFFETDMNNHLIQNTNLFRMKVKEDGSMEWIYPAKGSAAWGSETSLSFQPLVKKLKL